MNRRNFGKATAAIALAPSVAPVSVAVSFEERMIFKIGESLGIEKRDIQWTGGGYWMPVNTNPKQGKRVRKCGF